ncbi:MAG: hypothetical protein HY944_04045 [Gemmatimonadetes bacterium]|nr:hypothetical protein [Gemmatimonadota bacterium]
MNQSLRDRITRKLDSLSDDRGYQVLDYVEFLESKYAERQAPPPSVFQRFAEGVEDTMRAGRISTQAIGQTMDLMNKAMGVLSGVTAAGKSVADDLLTTASQITTNPLQNPPAAAAPASVAAKSVAPAAVAPATSSPPATPAAPAAPAAPASPAASAAPSAPPAPSPAPRPADTP